MKSTAWFLAGLSLIVSFAAHARETRSLNVGWLFFKGEVAQGESPALNDSGWEKIRLPHTWNTVDGQVAGKYYRGAGWYRKKLVIEYGPTRKAYLHFGAANQVADVFVNGEKVGRHEGGYTAFNVDITSAVRWGRENVIAVRVDNGFTADIAPVEADFTFFGGIYRGVSLVLTPPAHVDMLDYGSSGVYLTPVTVTPELAQIVVKARVTNDDKSPSPVTLAVEVTSPKGEIAGTAELSVTVAPGTTRVLSRPLAFKHPLLWDGILAPNLYQVAVRVRDNEGRTLDEVVQPLGLRTVSVDSERGFFLNGKRLELRGAAIHQDWQDKGWAIGNNERRSNVRILTEMGANAVRLCHYPRASEELDQLDKSGIVAWSEIPLVNFATPSHKFAETTKQQLREMIRQNYNHPSIAFWGLFNEVKADKSGLIAELDVIAREEDGTRLTGGASDRPIDFPLHKIPQVIAFNRYDGWYYNAFADFGKFIDEARKTLGKPVGVSEYGAGASPWQHQDPPKQPARGATFHPEEYQSLFHEAYLPQLAARPGLFGHFIWNLFDFAAANRNEGEIPGRNDKGLVSYDRKTRKDAYFFYKASWNPAPMVYVASRRFITRAVSPVSVKIYSNEPRVELRVNGRPVGEKAADGSRIFEWHGVTLEKGENRVEAAGPSAHDEVKWVFE